MTESRWCEHGLRDIVEVALLLQNKFVFMKDTTYSQHAVRSTKKRLDRSGLGADKRVKGGNFFWTTVNICRWCVTWKL